MTAGQRPSEPRPMSKKPKSRLRSMLINTALVLVAFGLLGWVVWSNRGPIGDVLNRKLDLRLIALGFAIYETALILTFFRWLWLVRVIEPSFRWRDAFLLGFIGNVFNLVIPGAVGGDLIKAAYLVKMKIKRTQAIASMVIDRVLGLLGLFLLAGVAGIFAWPLADVMVRRLIVVVWVFLALGGFGLAAVFGQSLTRRYPKLLEGDGRLAVILTELREMSETYRKRLGVVFGALALSSFNHSLNVLAFFTVSSAMFPTGLPSVAKHFLMVPLILFTTAVPLPFGALGLSEQVGQELFKLVSHPSGALAMMGFRVLMYAGALVSAIVYLANLRQVRSLTEAAEHLEEKPLEGDGESSRNDAATPGSESGPDGPLVEGNP